MTRPSLSSIAIIATAMAGIPITAYAAAEPATKSGAYYTKKICRSEKVIGSRLNSVRRCQSQAEWDEYRKEQRDVMHKMQTLKPTNAG